MFLLTIKLKSFSIFLFHKPPWYFFEELHSVVTSTVLQLFSEQILVSKSLKIRLWQGRDTFFLIVLCITVPIKLLLAYYSFFTSLCFLASLPSFIFQRLRQAISSSIQQFFFRSLSMFDLHLFSILMFDIFLSCIRLLSWTIIFNKVALVSPIQQTTQLSGRYPSINLVFPVA